MYVVLNGGFVFLAVFRTPVMDAVMPGGVNLAIAYGFAPMGVALVLALLNVYLYSQPGAHGTVEKARGNRAL